MEERRPRGATQGAIQPPTEPWADTVDGAALLDELSAVFHKHVIATDESTAAAVLWVPYAKSTKHADLLKLLTKWDSLNPPQLKISLSQHICRNLKPPRRVN